MLKQRYPQLLAIAYLLFFTALAINPVSRAVWYAEMLPAVIIFAYLLMSFQRFQFSNLAYSLMAFWLFWHTVGGHYTFANVPFSWVNDLLGSKRNHFDRIAHFSVGFYAFAIAEWAQRTGKAQKGFAMVFALFAIMSVAAFYEIVEWWYAASAGGDEGIEFLGSQGDVWDAQRDMLADTLGALFALVIYHFFGGASKPCSTQSCQLPKR